MSTTGHHLNFYLPEHQGSSMRRLSEFTGLGLSELMRRMVDCCLEETMLNRMFPIMSGQVAPRISEMSGGK